jgi:hypothetical protein
MAYVEIWFPQIPQVNMRLIAIKKNIYFDPNLLPDWNWKVGITRFEYVPKSLLCSGYSIFSLMCMLCRSLFVLLYFFWPFCCLFFDLWILATFQFQSGKRFGSKYIFFLIAINRIFTCGIWGNQNSTYAIGANQLTNIYITGGHFVLLSSHLLLMISSLQNTTNTCFY